MCFGYFQLHVSLATATAVNNSKTGKITELLADAEDLDTVAVGQDLFKYEPGTRSGET